MVEYGIPKHDVNGGGPEPYTRSLLDGVEDEKSKAEELLKIIGRKGLVVPGPTYGEAGRVDTSTIEEVMNMLGPLCSQVIVNIEGADSANALFTACAPDDRLPKLQL